MVFESPRDFKIFKVKSKKEKTITTEVLTINKIPFDTWYKHKVRNIKINISAEDLLIPIQKNGNPIWKDNLK